MNFVEAFRERAELQPGVPALIDRTLVGDRLLSYSGLNRLVDLLSIRLREAEVSPGDLFLLLLEPSQEFYAHFLAALMASLEPQVVGDALGLLAGRQERVVIVDGHAFARADERRPGSLPHCWDVTSDSLAARVAVVLGARRLVLLKSVSLPEAMDWPGAAGRGYVDGYFPPVLSAAPRLTVELVNFRQ